MSDLLDLIINTARNDDRIRAVIINGSRANPKAPKDIFQDYDIVYIVTSIDTFVNDHSWIDCFGQRMILQMPEAMQDPPPMNNGTFNYLMQLADGNRIDLTLILVSKVSEQKDDSLSVLLLDKDALFRPFPAPSEDDYLPKPPAAQTFSDCCNEFWWVSTNVAKGLWREEITYAKHMMDHYMREQLMKMLDWHVGINTDFLSSPGKLGKYLEKYLEPQLWDLLKQTYADASYNNT